MIIYSPGLIFERIINATDVSFTQDVYDEEVTQICQDTFVSSFFHFIFYIFPLFDYYVETYYFLD